MKVDREPLHSDYPKKLVGSPQVHKIIKVPGEALPLAAAAAFSDVNELEGLLSEILMTRRGSHGAGVDDRKPEQQDRDDKSAPDRCGAGRSRLGGRLTLMIRQNLGLIGKSLIEGICPNMRTSASPVVRPRAGDGQSIWGPRFNAADGCLSYGTGWQFELPT